MIIKMLFFLYFPTNLSSRKHKLYIYYESSQRSPQKANFVDKPVHQRFLINMPLSLLLVLQTLRSQTSLPLSSVTSFSSELH